GCGRRYSRRNPSAGPVSPRVGRPRRPRPTTSCRSVKVAPPSIGTISRGSANRATAGRPTRSPGLPVRGRETALTEGGQPGAGGGGAWGSPPPSAGGGGGGPPPTGTPKGTRQAGSADRPGVSDRARGCRSKGIGGPFWERPALQAAGDLGFFCVRVWRFLGGDFVAGRGPAPKPAHLRQRRNQ